MRPAMSGRRRWMQSLKGDVGAMVAGVKRPTIVHLPLNLWSSIVSTRGMWIRPKYSSTMSYQRPVTSRCYVITFKKNCDAFVEIIDDEIEQMFRNLKIYQFLKFPAFQQCIPLLFEILKFWNSVDEGFVVNGHLLKFNSDEMSLLTVAPPPQINIEAAPPPPQPPTTEAAPPPPTYTEAAPPPPQPPTTEAAPPPPTYTEAAPPPPQPPTTEAAPPPPTAENAQAIMKDDVIFQSENIVINRGDVDILTNQYLADNHVDTFAFFLSKKRRIMPKEFQNYLYISPLYRAYRGYKQNFKMFIQHINPNSIRNNKLIVQPICFKGRLKDKVWKLYDSLPNPEHKAIYTEVIKQIHKDKAGAFPSDIITWKLQTVRGVPTQSNYYDCKNFACKYMERAILRQKMDWASLKDWQKYMPKFRAELRYALCLTTKM
ncbi:hypothetical protein IEQ34_005119 [Dendrobium chrysotoxum]|uniref:Ubiquitin-like protease family profile domain-containing protein n=1 Tax=Dendrobium chrysotoxum TaxID=161865 RepID=A0AAV7H788_DENCH|nr:hypothetical protein IEQ34_005119 [Dendrobium chrysotoxum]